MEKPFINIKKKSECCGCNACREVCPVGCIEMIEDYKGFNYPLVDTDKCIKCGLCKKTCPFINCQKTNDNIVKTYAAYNIEEKTRMNSSSGGIFKALSDVFIKKGGVVFGAAFNDKWDVIHKQAESETELIPLMTSKYVQSDTLHTFKEVKLLLNKGKNVMYVGTQCQIAGLKNFLRKDNNNLLTVELICHGVPSPLVWRQYLNSQFNIDEIKDISFRDKTFSWEKFSLKIETDSNSLKEPLNENLYLRGFLKNLFLRPSCYSCKTKNGKSGADISLGDLWGIDNIAPDYNDHKGISFVIIHNEKAEKIINELSNIFLKEIAFDTFVKFNSAYHSSCQYPYMSRLFWNKFKKIGIDALNETLKIYKPSIKNKIRLKIYHEFSKYLKC